MGIVITAFSVFLGIRDAVLDPQERSKVLRDFIPALPWYWWMIIGIALLSVLALEGAYRVHANSRTAFRVRYKKKVTELRSESKLHALFTALPTSVLEEARQGKAMPAAESSLDESLAKAEMSDNEPRSKLKDGVMMLPPQSTEINANHARYGVWAVSFRNTSDAVLRNVVAQIDYRNLATDGRIHVNYGYWIEELNKRARLGIGDTKRIALVGQNGFHVYLFDNKQAQTSRGTFCELIEIPDAEWEARVVLVGEAYHQDFKPIRFKTSKYRDGSSEHTRIEVLPSYDKEDTPYSERAELIKTLSNFAEEGRIILEQGKTIDDNWPNAKEWAERAEAYVSKHIGEDAAAWFSLATTKAWPGLAVDRRFVDWMHTRIQRLGQLASEARRV